MPRASQLEACRRSRSPARRRRPCCENRARAWITSSSVATSTVRRSSSGRPRNAIGQRQQDAADLLRLLLLERDDVVVDLDGAQRLEEQARAAGRAAVHDARNRGSMLGAHDQHVAAVAIGDDLLLQILRRVRAAQVRLERRPQLRALAAQASRMRASSGLALSATSPDGSILRRTSAISPLNDATRSTSSLQDRKRAVDASDRAARVLDRLEEVGERRRAAAASSARPSTPSASMIASRSDGRPQRKARMVARESACPRVVACCAATTARRRSAAAAPPAGRAPVGVTARSATAATMRSNSSARGQRRSWRVQTFRRSAESDVNSSQTMD